jgi:ribosomal protein S18 acetylase RimI-like enzyme
VTYTLTRASLADLDTVVEMLTDRAAWLAQNGYDQWSEKDPARTSPETVAAGETWLLKRNSDSAVVGTLTMTSRADLDFWTGDDLATPAIYLSKLATPPEMAGQGLGRLLVRAAQQYAVRRQIHRLRWDVWRTNQHLQAYYQSLGATRVRSVAVSGRRSGTLFELPEHKGWTPDLLGAVEVYAPTGVVLEPEHETRRRTSILGEETSPIEGPRNWFKIPGLLVDGGGDLQPLEINDGMAGHCVLYHSGDLWRVSWNGCSPVVGAALEQLTPGAVYEVSPIGVGSEARPAIIGDVLDRQPTKQREPEAVPFS